MQEQAPLCWHVDVTELREDRGAANFVFKSNQLNADGTLGDPINVPVLIPAHVLVSMFQTMPTVIGHLHELGAPLEVGTGGH